MRWGVLILLVSASLWGADSAQDQASRVTFDGKEKIRPNWSPDGRTLTFARHESGGIHVFQYLLEPEKADSLARLTKRKEPEYQGVFTPDGKRIAFVEITLSGTQGNLDIALINRDGTEYNRILGDTKGLSHQEWPSISADGKRVVYSSTHEGNQEIYTSAIDGGDVRRVTQAPGHEAHPSWTKDGRSILFATDRWGGLELAICSDDGSGVKRLTTSPGLDDYASVSPDGTSVAYVSNRDGQYEVYLMDLDGSNPVNLTMHPGRDTQPSWSPDGRSVIFLSDRAGGCDVYSLLVPPRKAGGL